MRAETDNEITDWQRVADWRDSTSAVMAANDVLSLYMGGSARLGTITALTLYLDFTGTVSARTTIGGTQDLSATTLTTPTAGAIRTADLSVSEWADSWGFERINVTDHVLRHVNHPARVDRGHVRPRRHRRY